MSNLARNFSKGDCVLCVVQPNTSGTMTGLYGWIDEVYPDGYCVCLLARHEIQFGERGRNGLAANFSLTAAKMNDSHLRHLVNARQFGRAKRARAAHQRKEKGDAADRALVSAMVEKFTSPAEVKKREVKEAAILAEISKLGQLHVLPGRIKARDKSQYPSSVDPRGRAIEQERNALACRREHLTIAELAKLRLAQECIAQMSHWHPNQVVRNLVRELDLDPLCDEFNEAVYKRQEHAYVDKANLRKTVIRLLNAGASILSIGVANSSDESSDSADPRGYLVWHGFRRKLPVA